MPTTLSPRDLARAIGVSESSVKRWVDDGRIAASRTAGGHRRIATSEAVRFVRETRAPLVRPEILGLAELAERGEAPQAGEDGVGRFYELLRRGAAAEARGYLLSLYLDGRSVAQIVDGPLRGALERLGEEWLSDPQSGILCEHRATQIVMHGLYQLRGLFQPLPSAPLAIGGAPSGDPYYLPSLAISAVLESVGLRAVNLGPEMPIETLELAAESNHAQLIWLSVSVARHPEALATGVHGLLLLAERLGATVAIGGSACRQLELPPHPRLVEGGSMAELEALARGLVLRDPSGESLG